MIIKVSTDNRVTVHPYPKGLRKEIRKKMKELIGNRCDLIEPVYTNMYQERNIIMVVDEEGWLKPNAVNEFGSELYCGNIAGHALFVGEVNTEEGPDLGPLKDEDVIYVLNNFFEYMEKTPHRYL